MKHYGLQVAEGSKITNPVVDCGTSDPSNPDAGELFLRTDIGSGTLRFYDGTSWNNLLFGAASSTLIIDTDMDTKVDTEESADEDRIRFDTGLIGSQYPAQGNTLILSSGEFTLALPTALNSLAGGPIKLTAGRGGPGGAGQIGGNIELTAGKGGDAFGAGGAVNITAGESTGSGAGGFVNIVGGRALSGSQGGHVNITGAEAQSTGAGAGGNVYMTGGAGDGGGAPGDIFIAGGIAGSSGGIADGGNVSIAGGASTLAFGLDGGNVYIQGGDTSRGVSGAVDIRAGNTTASGYQPGTLTITGPNSVNTTPAVNVGIYGGGPTTSGLGGTILIKAGQGTGGNSGGALNLMAGDAANVGNPNGRDLTLRSGESRGSGTDGDIVFQLGASGANIHRFRGDDLTLELDTTSAPVTTTNRLYNVGGNLFWNAIQLDVVSSGLNNIVEDTTPQLGGNLDMNNFIIDTLRASTNFSLTDVDIGFGTTNNMGFTANSGGTAFLVVAGGNQLMNFTSTQTVISENMRLDSSTGAKLTVLISGSTSDVDIQPNGDPDTGVAFDLGGANTMSLVAGGVETLRVQNNGLLLDSTSSLVSITTTADKNILQQAGTGTTTGGSHTIRGGSSATGTAGDVILDGGNSTASGTAGDAIVRAGDSNSGTDGSVRLQNAGGLNSLRISNSGEWRLGAGDDPGTSGQVLTSNGTGAAPTWQAAGGGAVTLIQDADMDTQVQVEESADEDIIRFDTGDTPAGFGAVANIMTLASSGWTVAMGTANVATTAGAPISITSGTGNTTGAGGNIDLITGAGGASGNSGWINLTAAGGGANNGGNIVLDAGDTSGGTAGVINIQTGNATGGNIAGGYANITSGVGFGSGAGGAVNLTAGKGGATGTGGAASLTAGDGGGTSGAGGAATLQGGNADGSGAGGAANVYAGAGASVGGAVNIVAGASTGADEGGYVNITAGAGGASDGDGGKVVVTAGDAGATNADGGTIELRPGGLEGTGEDGVVRVIGPTAGSGELRLEDLAGTKYVGITSPTTVTTTYTMILPAADAAGALTSDGAGNMSFVAVGGTPIALEDADMDTKIQVEESADEDIIRFDTGDSPAGYNALTNILTIASSGILTNMGTTASAVGAPISLIAGASTYGGADLDPNGGTITITGGSAYSYRAGDVNITGGLGDPATEEAYGGHINITGGNAYNYPGNVTITGGSQTTGSYLDRGHVFIRGATNTVGTSGAGNVYVEGGNAPEKGGTINITGGDTTYVGAGNVSGSVIIKSGGTNGTGPNGGRIDIITQPGGSESGPIKLETQTGSYGSGDMSFITQNAVSGGAGGFTFTQGNHVGTTDNIGFTVNLGNVSGSTNRDAGDVEFNLGNSTSTATVPGTDAYGGSFKVKAGNSGNGQAGGLEFEVGSSVSGNAGQIEFITNDGALNQGAVIIRGAGNQSRLQMRELPSNGTNHIELKAPIAITSDVSWQLPDDIPAASGGKFLTTDTSGFWSFDDVNNLQGANANPVATGTGETVTIDSGIGGSTSGDAGDIDVTAGTAAGSGADGRISFTTGGTERMAIEADGDISGLPYDIAATAFGAPTAATVFGLYVAVRSFKVLASGHDGYAITAPTGTACTITVNKNGSSIGTLVFNAASNTLSSETIAETSFVAGDRIDFTMTTPSAVADVSVTLAAVTE